MKIRVFLIIMFVALFSSCAVLQERSLPISKVDYLKHKVKGKVQLEISYQQYQCASSWKNSPCRWANVESQYLSNSIRSALKQFEGLSFVDSGFDYKISLKYQEKLLKGVKWYTFISLGVIPAASLHSSCVA